VIKPRPLPRLRVQIPFERSFTRHEFLRLSRGFVAQSMEDRWHVFFTGPWLTFVRSWSGFCIYEVRMEKNDVEYRVATVFMVATTREKKRSSWAFCSTVSYWVPGIFQQAVRWFLVSGCLGILVTLANVAAVHATNPSILLMPWPSSVVGPAPASDSVLSDIVHQQRDEGDEGLTIVFYDHTLSAVSFNHRSKLTSVNFNLF
jgi:hypothetical protein